MNENKAKVWLARDMNGSLYLSQIKPKKENFGWVLENPEYANNYVKIDANNFPSVKWEDDEPTEAYITLANVPQEKKEIDWEQRRYEIAKELIASFATKENLIDFIRQEERYADFAIHIADALIKELKTYPK